MREIVRSQLDNSEVSSERGFALCAHGTHGVDAGVGERAVCRVSFSYDVLTERVATCV
jgi:hypothetical protein